MKAIIVVFISLCLAFVAAQGSTPFYITSPISGTTYKAGSTITLKWINGINETATVELITGTTSSAMKSTSSSFSINGADGEQTWKVPSDLPQNATFAFMIHYTDANKALQTSFSSPFAITGTNGTVVTQSFVTAASTSAAVSASSASIVPASSSMPVSIVTPSVHPSASASMIATSTPSAPSGSAAGTTTASFLTTAGAIVVIGSVLFF
ncbi:hypothetical protein K501DRAFT_337089 [Backusella circina FSU 941]|nr:hypothetical protein K501DRAFT_337089 [Backusella circina FSU 941]